MFRCHATQAIHKRLAFHTGFSSNDFIRTNKIIEHCRALKIYLFTSTFLFAHSVVIFVAAIRLCLKSEDRIKEYVDAVIAEIRQMAACIDKKRMITQVSWEVELLIYRFVCARNNVRY